MLGEIVGNDRLAHHEIIHQLDHRACIIEGIRTARLNGYVRTGYDLPEAFWARDPAKELHVLVQTERHRKPLCCVLSLARSSDEAPVARTSLALLEHGHGPNQVFHPILVRDGPDVANHNVRLAPDLTSLWHGEPRLGARRVAHDMDVGRCNPPPQDSSAGVRGVWRKHDVGHSEYQSFHPQ